MIIRPRLFSRCILAVELALFVATLAAAADPLVHVVAKGETLYSIARKYDISVDSLATTNTISDPSKLFVGMKLSIPLKPGETPVKAPLPVPTVTPAASVKTIEYVVKKGDTLYGIAKAHGVSVDAIVKSSGISGKDIKPGQKLRIPGGTAASLVTVTPASTLPASTAPAASATASSVLWPVRGPVIYLKGKLKGVSIASGGASGIQAIRSGTVISAGPFRGFGQVAFVQAADGLVYVYGGASELSVRLGDTVRKGSIIGRTGSEKDASAYFFAFKGADTIDPDSVPRD
jgi:LysM repeat protein